MKIDYPTNEEQDLSIAKTIEQAYPKQDGVLKCMMRLYRQIGFEFLIHGIKEILVLIIVIYGIGILLHGNLEQYMKVNTYHFIILFSPIAFQVLLSLSILSEKEQHVYEAEMTCKYTVFHILTLRMLLFCVCSILLNATFCIAVFYVNGMEAMLRMVFLSVTVLLIYTILYLHVLIKDNCIWNQIILYLGWCIVNLLFKAILPMTYEYIALRLPIVCHVFVWFLLTLLIERRMSEFFFKNCKFNLYAGG